MRRNSIPHSSLTLFLFILFFGLNWKKPRSNESFTPLYFCLCFFFDCQSFTMFAYYYYCNNLVSLYLLLDWPSIDAMNLQILSHSIILKIFIWNWFVCKLNFDEESANRKKKSKQRNCLAFWFILFLFRMIFPSIKNEINLLTKEIYR